MQIACEPSDAEGSDGGLRRAERFRDCAGKRDVHESGIQVVSSFANQLGEAGRGLLLWGRSRFLQTHAASGCLYTLIGTAKLNGLDPTLNFRTALTRIAEHPITASANSRPEIRQRHSNPGRHPNKCPLKIRDTYLASLYGVLGCLGHAFRPYGTLGGHVSEDRLRESANIAAGLVFGAGARSDPRRNRLQE